MAGRLGGLEITTLSDATDKELRSRLKAIRASAAVVSVDVGSCGKAATENDNPYAVPIKEPQLALKGSARFSAHCHYILRQS